MEDNLLEETEKLTEEELIAEYGSIPKELKDKPSENTIDEAVDGSLDEDKDVIFNEISN